MNLTCNKTQIKSNQIKFYSNVHLKEKKISKKLFTRLYSITNKTINHKLDILYLSHDTWICMIDSISSLCLLVPKAGLELATVRFPITCSTNWAIRVPHYFNTQISERDVLHCRVCVDSISG